LVSNRPADSLVLFWLYLLEFLLNVSDFLYLLCKLLTDLPQQRREKVRRVTHGLIFLINSSLGIYTFKTSVSLCLQFSEAISQYGVKRKTKIKCETLNNRRKQLEKCWERAETP